MAIFWDGVTYYNFQAYREYLMTINQDLSEKEWLINCTLICSKFFGAKLRSEKILFVNDC